MENRQSRRLLRLEPENGILPVSRRMTRVEVLVQGAQTVAENQDSRNVVPGTLENDQQSSASKCVSWLFKNRSEASRKPPASRKSTVSSRMKILELQTKAMEEQHRFELDIARRKLEFEVKELEMRNERSKLLRELDLARLEEEEKNSQYLGSDDLDADIWRTAGCAEKQKENLVEDEPIRLSKNMHKPGASNKTYTISEVKSGEVSSLARINLQQNSQVATFSADQLSLLFQAQDLARTSNNTGGGEIKKFVARQSGVTVLPDFYGDPTKWPMFISHFTGTTKACGYTDFDNVCRLRKSLKGKALAAVEDMLNHEDKLQEIMLTLEENFGQPEEIVKSLIVKMKKVASVKEEKPETVIDFSNTLKNLVATLESLKKTNHLCNPTLLEDLLEKLPTSFRTKWGEELVSLQGEATLKTFATWIEKRAKVARLIRNSISTTEVKTRENEKLKTEDLKKRGNRKETVLATTDGQETKKENGEKSCDFCSMKRHTTVDCRKFAKLEMDDKWKWAEENKVCYSCLSVGHSIKFCKLKKKCEKDGCGSMHHPLLHRDSEKVESKTETVAHTMNEIRKTSSVFLRILPVTLMGPKGKINIFALLDDASTVTLLDSSVADRLGLEGPKKYLRMCWTNSVSAVEPDSRSVDLKIKGSKLAEWNSLENVRTVSNLQLPSQSVNMLQLTKRWKHLRGLPVDSLHDAVPSMLIGDGHCQVIASRELREGSPFAPMASLTKLGWVVHGPTGNPKNPGEFTFFHVKQEEEEIVKLLKDSWSTESFGVKVTQDLPQSVDDLRAMKLINENTRRIGEKFETALLWKKDDTVLPASKSNALQRLKMMEKKMDRDPVFEKLYKEKIQEYVDKGYVRKLSSDEAKVISKKTWFLPHFAVLNPNKPGQIRLVFDAAAKSNGVSLNDVLLSGPDLLTSLTGVLLRFREGRVGFSGDIRDMFHQIQIRKEDRCAQRFLWRANEKERDPDVYEMQVMTFGATCSPSLAQVVKNKNATEFEAEFPDAVRAITHRHYVDDYLDGTATEEEAIKRMKEVRELHRRGGFEIRKWSCSSAKALEEICRNTPEADMKTKNLNLGGELPNERALGLHWDPNRDEFFFACKFEKVDGAISKGEKCPTKREVLKLFMSLFDPLGFVAHYIVKARIVFQDIWRSGIGWDDELSEVQFERWRNWLLEMKNVTEMRIPRCYSKMLPTAESIHLHTFVDASEEAFAAVSYLRVEMENTVDVILVMAKTRVAPLKPMTIPKLELQAALMGSRLATTVEKELDLKIGISHFWSDSRTVLCWLRSDARKYKPFVACRVGEILENTNLENWHWVPTKLNVADEATRSSSTSNFSIDCRWINGPEFLKLKEAEWPEEKQRCAKLEDIENELEPECEMKTEYVNVHIGVSSCLPDVRKFSRWSRLLRSAGWMLRFINNCRSREKKSGELTPQELLVVERKLLAQSQVEAFPEELANLDKKKQIPRTSRLINLCPFLDEHGLMCVKGRSVNATELSEGAKMPIILDPKNAITRLIVMHYHVLAGHAGQNYVLNEIRQKFWIVDGRAAVKSTWNSCNVCKVNRAKPIPPEMAPLPSVRVTRPSRPFTVVGVDYFGPLEVTIGRRHEKRYGVLFTCLSVRAIHLEIAASLTTDSAIMAIRRFIARRGCPERLYSDNGTNFHGAEKELKLALKELDQERLVSTLSLKGIEWNFISPSAPHMAGSWERLIRSVKVALKANLKEKAPKEEILQTVFAEAENVVNGRPLTHISVDPQDLECLTPNHFLLGGNARAPVPGEFASGDLCSRKQWRASQALADQFWKRWLHEYLPSLNTRPKWQQPTKPIEVGDLVFIADGNLPRNSWPRGIIQKIYPGSDGVTRIVDVKTATGVFRRPVVKVCRFGMKAEVPTVEAKPIVGVESPEEPSTGGSVSSPQFASIAT